MIPLWQSPPVLALLPSGALHLWRFSLNPPPLEFSLLKSLLRADEVLRAGRLFDRSKAQRWVAARGRLRQILGNYLRCDPASLHFDYNGDGKPFLPESLASPLQFNLSHAGEWGVIALAVGVAVGVDIEKIDPLLDYERLAARFFTVAENSCLAALAPQRRRRGFYRLWTRKEALLKGKGVGFSGALVAEEGGGQYRSFWLAPGYVGGVAGGGAIESLQRFSL